MSGLLVKEHPTLGILVRSDGAVYCSHGRSHIAEWNYGSKNGSGYMLSFIKGKRYSVHRLVAETFIPNPNNLPLVDHLDRCRHRNEVGNLRWTDYSGNMKNTEVWELVDKRDGVHSSEDFSGWQKEYRKRKKVVRFAGNVARWVDINLANELLKKPMKERDLSETES